MDVRLEVDRIRRYLLAELPEMEQLRLEEQLFQDHDLFEQVCAIEADLIDEYVRGELPDAARRQFETAYLASQAQRGKVELARALQKSVFNPR